MSRGGLVRNLVAGKSSAWLHRLARAADPYVTLTWSQEGEDLVLGRLIGGQAPGFYVDVGAHHPLRFSNTQFFYSRGWRGINIDPNPEAIRLFARVRPRDINLAFGIADAPGMLRYFRFNESALNTFDAQLAHEREALPDYRLLEAMSIPVMRLDAVLDRHLLAGQAIDFLSVDTEGFDLRVLRSNDWTRYRPRWVLTECLGTSLESVLAEPLHRHMSDTGYELVAKTLNTLFYRDRGDAGARHRAT